MNKYLLLLFFLTLVYFFCSCQNQSEADKTRCVKPDSINPNGSSELSLLMRQMHDRAAEMKQLVEQGKQLGSFPEEFKNLNTAVPTDSTTKKSSFDAFAQNYLSALQSVYHSEEGMVTSKYNEMVNACLSCHSDHCPGPVPKIKKLVIN